MACKRYGVRLPASPPVFINMKHKNLEEIVAQIPRHTLSYKGRLCEPINLIVIGSRWQLQKNFIKNGWKPAVGLSPISALHALFAAIANISYPTGPVGTLYIHRRPQRLAFQKPTRSNSFRRRHHLRLWHTPYRFKRSPVWIGMLSYDRSTGHYKNSPIPTHHISPSLTSEEDYLAKSFDIKHPRFVKLANPERGNISNGDAYYWDGRALLINLGGEL